MAAQKKSQIAQERDEGARGLWRWFLTRFDVRRLVFVDESGMHIAMDRLRARAPRGERAYGKVPRNRGKNLTLLASMSLSGMGEAMCVEGATDAEAFEVYVEHFLAPTLKEGQVVVFDNLGAHKPKRIRELIEARGAEVLFLPSYSPDLNPIVRSVLQDQGHPSQGGSAHSRGFTRSDSGSALGHHARGRGWVVRSLWLRGRGSILMNTAVINGFGRFKKALFGELAPIGGCRRLF